MRIFSLIADVEENSIEGNFILIRNLIQKLALWVDRAKEDLAVSMAIAAAGVIAGIIMWFVFSKLLSRMVKRVSPAAEEVFRQLAIPVAMVGILTGLSLANNAVDFPGRTDAVLDKIFYAGFILCFVWGIMRAIGVFDRRLAEKRKATPGAGMEQLVADLLSRTLRSVVWFIALVFVSQNLFGFNVTALLTGAGVAGLAIAFAAQNTIANIFGAISIVTDKIFKVGDFVAIDGKNGTIEEVGFRSTKLRSLDGTLWNLPNRLIADAPVENFSARKNIKFAFTLNLVYSTTPEQMQQALDILDDIFSHFHGFDLEKNPPSFKFTAFNASSLDIGVIVWFNTRDFMESQKMKQEMNMQILSRFNAAGLSFAYPSVTNYIVEQK